MIIIFISVINSLYNHSYIDFMLQNDDLLSKDEKDVCLLLSIYREVTTAYRSNPPSQEVNMTVSPRKDNMLFHFLTDHCNNFTYWHLCLGTL